MKIKSDFVTNSSSTSFIIINKTDLKKDLVDFVSENPQLIEEFINMYDWNKDDSECTQEKLLESAKINNISLPPGRTQCVFGDEDGTLIGRVFDYILREGGASKSFMWNFDEFLR